MLVTGHLVGLWSWAVGRRDVDPPGLEAALDLTVAPDVHVGIGDAPVQGPPVLAAERAVNGDAPGRRDLIEDLAAIGNPDEPSSAEQTDPHRVFAVDAQAVGHPVELGEDTLPGEPA